MKILNVNKISKKSDRVLEIDGVKHEVLAVTVGGFLNINDMVATLANSTPAEQIKLIVDTIVRQVPTVPRERLLDLDLETVNEIASYVRGEEVEHQEDMVAEAAEAQAGK